MTAYIDNNRARSNKFTYQHEGGAYVISLIKGKGNDKIRQHNFK